MRWLKKVIDRREIDGRFSHHALNAIDILRIQVRVDGQLQRVLSRLGRRAADGEFREQWQRIADVDVHHLVHAHLAGTDAHVEDGLEEAVLGGGEVADRLLDARLFELEVGVAVQGGALRLDAGDPFVEAGLLENMLSMPLIVDLTQANGETGGLRKASLS